MIMTRTTALMLAMATSLLATPAAFAQIIPLPPLIGVVGVNQTAGIDDSDTNTQ